MPHRFFILRTAARRLSLFLFTALFLCAVPARGQDDDEGLWFMTGAQYSSLAFDTMSTVTAFGVSFELGGPSPGHGIFLRNRYLLGKDYFKFSTAPLFLLMLESDWLLNGDNDMDSDGDTTLRETCTGPFFRGMLAGITLIFNDGFGYAFPLGKKIGIGPFVSPVELYFYRPPGGRFGIGSFTSFGLSLRAAPKAFGNKIFFGAEGEYVRPVLFRSGEAGYRVNLTAGIAF